MECGVVGGCSGKLRGRRRSAMPVLGKGGVADCTVSGVGPYIPSTPAACDEAS